MAGIAGHAPEFPLHVLRIFKEFSSIPGEVFQVFWYNVVWLFAKVLFLIFGRRAVSVHCVPVLTLLSQELRLCPVFVRFRGYVLSPP